MELIAQWFILWSFLIGILGSLGYFTAVYFGFVAFGPEGREYILTPFRDSKATVMCIKVGWFCTIGGLIAAIFQLPQSEFVPIQSFVLGATWPSIVGQLLSGRQIGPSRDELTGLGLTSEAASASERETQAAPGEAVQLEDELERLGLTRHSVAGTQRTAEETSAEERRLPGEDEASQGNPPS